MYDHCTIVDRCIIIVQYLYRFEILFKDRIEKRKLVREQQIAERAIREKKRQEEEKAERIRKEEEEERKKKEEEEKKKNALAAMSMNFGGAAQRQNNRKGKVIQDLLVKYIHWKSFSKCGMNHFFFLQSYQLWDQFHYRRFNIGYVT